MTYTSDDARAYIAAVRWQFASTMPRIPHWYTVRKWRPELDDDFVALVRHIQFVGVRMDWPDPRARPHYRNRYLLLDGWKYWTMGDPHPGVVPPIETPEATGLVNRARIEPRQKASEPALFHRRLTHVPWGPRPALQVEGGATRKEGHALKAPEPVDAKQAQVRGGRASPRGSIGTLLRALEPH